jgi:hypothetical protein
MKLLLGLFVGLVLLICTWLIAGRLLLDARSREAFAQLPPEFQRIAVYPHAQNVWMGASEDVIGGYQIVQIISFTSSDYVNDIMEYYKTALQNDHWSYDRSGHASVRCDGYLEGDFYHNSQGSYVWVASRYAGTGSRFELIKVQQPFSYFGDCLR